jgi:hypothetical protein
MAVDGTIVLDRKQIDVFQPTQGQLPLAGIPSDQRFGEAGDHGRRPQRIETVLGRGTIEQTEQSQDRQLPQPFLSPAGEPFFVGFHRLECVTVGARGVVLVFLVGIRQAHGVALANVAVFDQPQIPPKSCSVRPCPRTSRAAARSSLSSDAMAIAPARLAPASYKSAAPARSVKQVSGTSSAVRA